jgi:hypothetical protein
MATCSENLPNSKVWKKEKYIYTAQSLFVLRKLERIKSEPQILLSEQNIANFLKSLSCLHPTNPYNLYRNLYK